MPVTRKSDEQAVHQQFTLSAQKSLAITIVPLMVVLLVIGQSAFRDGWLLALLILTAVIVGLAQQTLS
jgi:hypothetical protein